MFIENYIGDNGTLIPVETVFAECVVGLERTEMVLQDLPNVYHVQRFAEWRKQLTEASLNSRNVDAEHSINIMLDHLVAFVKLTEDGSPAPGRGGRAAIMRKLARGLMTHMLLLNWDVQKRLNSLSDNPEQKIALHYLHNEWQHFFRTLRRGKQSLHRLLVNKKLTHTKLIDLEKNSGVPALLLKKYSIVYQSQNDLGKVINHQTKV